MGQQQTLEFALFSTNQIQQIANNEENKGDQAYWR